MPKVLWPDTRFQDARILTILWLSSLLLLLATVLHVYFLEKQDRSREFAVAERQLSNLTRVSQEHANRTFQSADQVIRFVQSRYLEVGAKLDLQELTAKGVIDTQIFNQVGIIDATGIYSLSNLPIKQKMDLSDREHFRVHVAADTGQMFISKPVMGRASGKWSIQLTRRITRSDGTFAGVVVVSIDPGYFTRFYADLDLGAQGLAALYGMDGVARARMVGDVADYGAQASKSRVFAEIDGGSAYGSYTQRSVVDGLERLYYYRKVPAFPLVVLAGTEVRYLLAGHIESRNALFLQAGLLSLLIIFLAVALTYHLKKIRKETASRHMAEMENRRRAVQLSAIFTMSPDGFVSFDEKRQIQYVNPAFGRMTGMPTDSLRGMDEMDFSAWLSSRCTGAAAFQGLAKMHSHSGPDGRKAFEIIEVAGPDKRLLQVGLLQSDSESVPLILYFRDVTQEVEVDRMKSEFLSTAAHELRTPMASIYGFVEILLSDGGLNAAQQEYLEIVDRQSKLMVHILNDLLDLARIEARRGSDFKYTELDVQALLRNIVQSFPLPAQRAQVRLNMPEQAIVLSADEGKLRQVMVNILSNAYKFSAVQQGVEVDLELQQENGAKVVCIHVTDHGIGMTAEQLAQVFVRFYRADASGKVSGTGLGMSIVKEIVELHGGRIALQSSPGQGTRVSLWLPLLADKPRIAH
jgi:signal transduction histidine kinase